MNSLKDTIIEMEHEGIFSALSESGWVMTRATRLLGITGKMIGSRVKKLGIRRVFEVGMEFGYELELCTRERANSYSNSL